MHNYSHNEDIRIRDSVIEQLQHDPLTDKPYFDLAIDLPLSYFAYSLSFLFSIPRTTTTLRQYILDKVNQNPGDSIYIGNVWNILCSSGNPARFFKGICSETHAISERVYNLSLIPTVATTAQIITPTIAEAHYSTQPTL